MIRMDIVLSKAKIAGQAGNDKKRKLILQKHRQLSIRTTAPKNNQLFILILTPVLLPHLQQVFKQDHSVFFHLAGIEEFLVMLEPVAVVEAFFGVVAGRIAVIGFDEGLHFLVFL